MKRRDERPLRFWRYPEDELPDGELSEQVMLEAARSAGPLYSAPEGLRSRVEEIIENGRRQATR